MIKITKANYGGYGSMKTCGYNRNYNCLLPSALCYMRRKCDGRQSCEINATTEDFKDDACPGMKKYLYVEYRCVERKKFRKENVISKFACLLFAHGLCVVKPGSRIDRPSVSHC